jgi:heat shock protein HtpX
MGTMFKRMFFFFLTNILILVMITIIHRALGLDAYLTPMGINYQSLMAYCVIWGFVGSFTSLFLSKFMAKMMYGVKIIPAGDARYAEIVEMTHRHAKLAGIKAPEVGVYESPEPNAFATGYSKNSSLVAVSTGLLRSMSKDEVEGVIAHEVAHAANGDMVTMTLVQGVVNTFVLFFAKIAAFAVSNALRSGNDRDSESSSGNMTFFIADIVFQILFGILGSMVVCYFSRWREFRADAGGARLAGKEKMLSALRKLEMMHKGIAPQEADSFATMKIAGGGTFMKLFSTHPPLEARIKALSGSSARF